MRSLPYLLIPIAALPLGSLRAEEARPALEKLVELNGEKVFGTKAILEGERLKLEFKKSSDFSRFFEGQGMQSAREVKGFNPKVLENPWGGEFAEPVVVGKGDGDWLSRCELSDVHMSFRMRVYALQKGCQFALRINQSEKSLIQVPFFQSAAILSKGKVKKRVNGGKDIQGPPEKWWDLKGILETSVHCQDGKFSLKSKVLEKEKDDKLKTKKELDELAFDDIADAPAGRIGFSFRNMVFSMGQLTISGKVDRAWIESQMRDLEAKGALALKEPASEAPREQPARRQKKEADDKERRKKEAEEQL